MFVKKTKSNSMFNSKYIKSFYNINMSTMYKPNTHTLFTKKLIQNEYFTNNNKLIEHFKYFINVNTFVTKNDFNVHFNWKFFFYTHNLKQPYFINLNRLFLQWRRVYYFLFNIFYFKFNLLFFSNVLFRNEVNALNWNSNTYIKQIWRFIVPFFSLKPGKIFNYGWWIFLKLKYKNYHLAFVVDLFYHRKTLNYLDKAGFYTIGLVPSNYNPLLVDFPILISSDNFFTQLFFLNYIVRIKQNINKIQYNNIKILWKKFLNTYNW